MPTEAASLADPLPPADQATTDAQSADVGGGASERPPATSLVAMPTAAPSLADPLLALLADTLDDLERTRISNENRLRHLTRSEPDADGDIRGLGLDVTAPGVDVQAGIVDALARLEHDATLNLRRSLRRHSLGAWVKATDGVGEKQGARLLAAIGDPYWNDLHGRPRTVSQLWAYCGYHVLRPGGQGRRDTQSYAAAGPGQTGGDTDHTRLATQATDVGVAASRTKGQRDNWSAIAKMRVYLIAESCMKCRQSPYRLTYEDARVKYAESLHAVECRRCGPAGKPAPAGSPLSAGHQHARALRIVSKAILRDLWRESKRLHESGSVT